MNVSSLPPADQPLSRRLLEVALLFLKLGVISFGGPAAHIALMHAEVVKRRRWLTDQQFLDLLGMTNLIPGPNSTEMVINIGFHRAGWPGCVTRTTSGMKAVRNCIRDEGRPFGAGFQEQAPNHLKLLWSKAAVVNVEEEGLSGKRSGMNQGDERK